MTQAQPQTIANQLMTRLDAFGRPEKYQDLQNNFVLRSILNECDKLIKVDPVKGRILKARVFTFCGDESRVRECFSEARHYSLSVSDKVNYALCLSDLGYFSEAQKYFLEAIDPQFGSFNSFFTAALSTGAYIALCEMKNRASSMNIPISEEYQEAVISYIGQFMRNQNITDLMLASYLDLAGEVLRDRKMLASDVLSHAEVFDMDDLQLVHQKLFIEQNPELVADMNMQLMEVVVERNMPNSDSIMVSFEPLE